MEPRRVSTRYRGEPPPKRKRLTPTPPPPPSSSRAKQPSRPSLQAEAKEEEMPTKVKEDKPLPKLTEPQAADLADDVFQTIGESGVLKESLERSRRKWMEGSMFEKYWTKPTKKKGAPEIQQPAKETMAKLGPCSMVVGPHTFDLTLYTIKEPQAQPPIQFPAYPQTPQSYSQYNPYPHTGTYTSTYGPPFTGSVLPEANPPPRKPSVSQSPLPGFREGFSHADTRTTPAPIPQSASPHPPAPSPHPPPSRRLSKSSNSSGQGRPSAPQNTGGPSADPVIQMLAQRAGQDPRLKSLMTIVAAGDASSDQLKEFQSHIDELNTLLKDQKSKPSPSPPAPAPVKVEPPPPARPTYTIPPYSAPPPRPAPTPYAPVPAQPIVPVSATIVFDFTGAGATGDRYLFPKQSIIEYQPGSMSLLASFLIIRQGSELATRSGNHYKASQQYFESITLKLNAANAKILEPFARAVKPAKEVREYMEKCFKTMERGRKVWLATRLPREKKVAGEDVGKGSEDTSDIKGKKGASGGQARKKRSVGDWDVVKSVYEAPNSMPPL